MNYQPPKQTPKHFKYNRLENENSIEEELTSKITNKITKIEVTVKNNKKSTNSDEGLLIDLTEAVAVVSPVSDPSKQKSSSLTARSGNGSSQTLFDTLTSSQYGHLPPAVFDKPETDDPFEIKASVKNLVASSCDTSPVYNRSSSQPLIQAQSSPSLTHTPHSSTNLQLDKPPVPPRIYSNAPGMGGSPVFGDRRSAPASSSTYRNLPDCSDMTSGKRSPIMMKDWGAEKNTVVPPSEPSSKGRYYSLPPLQRDNNSEVLFQSSPFYDLVPEEETLITDKQQKSASKVDAVQVTKAFDWVSDAVDVVAGFSLGSAKPESANDKAGLLGPERMYDKVPMEDPYRGDLRVELPTRSVRSKTTDINQAHAAFSYAGFVSESSTESDSSDEPPALPPRDFKTEPFSVGKTSSSASLPPVKPAEPIKPKILPVQQDGKQLSNTHYFLIPPKGEKASVTAAVKPYSVDGAQVGNSRFYDVVAPYQNIHTITNEGFTTDETDSLSWSGMTGLKAVGAHDHVASSSHVTSHMTSETVSSSGLSSTSSGGSIGGVQMSPREKVRKVQEQVHGVTEEESHTALLKNKWEIEAATKYLKLEQLFRLGIATREKCQRLLETFQWNLEMAGSVLLDELQTGSLV